MHLLRTTSLAALLGLPCCVSVEQITPAAERLPGTSVEEAERQSTPSFVGLELRESLAGSLEELSFDPGLEVVSVAKGSPASQAGIRRGDRIVSADGMPLERADQWGALLAARAVGDTLLLQVERDAGLVDVPVTVAPGGTGRLPVATRFVEHWKGRLVVQSRVLPHQGAEVVAAEIVRLLPGSPLQARDLGPGTVILSLASQPVRGAQDLVARLSRCGFGETVDLEVLRGDTPETVPVGLWSPPRRVTRVGVPVLFGYEADVVDDEVRFTLLDLWLLSLFEYRREGQARSWSVLRWIRFETGVGELQEVTGGAAAMDKGP